MKRYALTAILLAAILNAGRARAQDPPEVRVDVSSREVYEGQSLEYYVQVTPGEDAAKPRIDFGPDFEVQYLGEQLLGRMRHQVVINGRVMENRNASSRVFGYRLTPRKTGLLIVPAPEVDAGGQTIRGAPTSIEVSPADAQDAVKIWISVDDEHVYPMQPLTVTLSVAVRELPPPYENEDPIAVLSRPPGLQVPWVDDQTLPAGLEPEEAWDQWLGELQRARVGFSVNGLRSRGLDMPSMFGGGLLGDDFFDSPLRSREYTFLPRPEKVEMDDASGRPAVYWRYDFVRTFTPTKAGPLHFGPATLTGTFVTGVSGDRGITESLHLVAEPAAVTVESPPQAGRPDAYTGAIGRFDLSARLAPTDVAVGDPLTLTLEVTGSGAFDYIGAPDLVAIDQIADHFKVYEATEDRSASKCTFTYSLRPLDASPREFPPVPLAYFDVETEQYRTISTRPIPLTIREADRLSSRDIVAAPQAARPQAETLEARSEGVFANITDPSRVRDESVDVGRWGATMASLAVLYAAALLVVKVRERTAESGAARRRSAVATARQRLESGLAMLEQGDGRGGAETVYSAFAGLVAAAENTSEAGLTPRDVETALGSRGLGPEVVRQCVRVLELCDAARYGAGGDPAEMHRLGAPAFEELARAMRTPRILAR